MDISLDDLARRAAEEHRIKVPHAELMFRYVLSTLQSAVLDMKLGDTIPLRGLCTIEMKPYGRPIYDFRSGESRVMPEDAGRVVFTPAPTIKRAIRQQRKK